MDQFAWRPLGMGSMCRRHVVGNARVEALAVAPGMTGGSAPPGQDLDAATGDAQFNLLTYQGVRHAVVVVIKLDVVVDIDAGALPLGEDERGFPAAGAGRVRRAERRRPAGSREVS